MNAERLSMIVRAVKEDMDKIQLLTRLDALIAALNNVISNPAQQHQEQVSQERKALSAALAVSTFSQFPRTWRSALEEIGIFSLLGTTLSATINDIFTRNQITLTDARAEIQRIRGTLGNFNTAFEQLIAAFSFLKIAERRPEPGEAEISVVMPRRIFENELGGFANEVKVVDQALKFFSELTTGSREAPQIKQISTTDPTLLVTCSPYCPRS